MKLKLALLSATLLVPLQAAQAQNDDYYRVRLGAGAQIRPSFVGSDDHEWAPLGNFDIKRGSEQFDFEAPDDNFSISIYKQNGFSFGPVANLQSGRKNSDVGADVGRVKSTIELGGFVQYRASDSIRIRAEVRQGLGGHDGLVASLGADQIWRDGDRYVFSIGPRVQFSNSKYQRAWFGVSEEASLATGLPEYRPDAGFHAVGAAAGAKVQLSGPIGMFGYARYDRLIGDAGDSPLIREFGSRGQTSAGLGLTYTFTIKR